MLCIVRAWTIIWISYHAASATIDEIISQVSYSCLLLFAVEYWHFLQCVLLVLAKFCFSARLFFFFLGFFWLGFFFFQFCFD